MSTKLWNTGTDGFTSDFSLGGLPIFTEDLQMMQNNATEIYGMLSLLKGWSCVVRGCLVDEVNTSAKTIKVLPGVVLLNDRLYTFDGYEGVYPFAIRKSVQEVDTRIFKDGSTKDVATSYNVGFRNAFTFGPVGSTLESLIPTDLSNEEIYFDPFTAQKASLILKNLSVSLKEMKSIYGNSEITKTETGKSIVGNSLNWLVNGREGRWSYLGWGSFVTSPDFTLRNAGIEGGVPGTGSGSNNVRLSLTNIPKHIHSSGNFKTGNVNDTDDSIDDGTNHLSGEHTHNLNRREAGNYSPNVEFQDTRFSTINFVNEPNRISVAGGVQTGGEHSHPVYGFTGEGEGLLGTAEAIDIKGSSLYCRMLAWNGYNSVESFYKFNAGIVPYSNM